MRPVLLIDFGSTYTKLTAVDLETPSILGSAQAFTTADSDISIGLNKAMSILEHSCGAIDYQAKLACSSAAGGLKMVVCGLVPALTGKAAQLAAFGAGAKVIRTFAYRLTSEDIDEIRQAEPDILLLTGGTDGGNSENIIANAQALSCDGGSYPIIIAGNRSAGRDCTKALEGSGHPVFLAPNVMPEMNRLNAGPVQEMIRDLFLKRIVRAKGMSSVSEVLDGILMPTPSAVLEALTLLSEGTERTRGLGELIAVDLGGATTDVYSIARGDPSNPNVFLRGLPEPHAKRTVEGDIGMRYSARGVIQAVGAERLANIASVPAPAIMDAAEAFRSDPSKLPETREEQDVDRALAIGALYCALARHAGTLERVYTPIGPVDQQTGKDLTRTELMLLTGGALIYAPDLTGIVNIALSMQDPTALTPRHVKALCDSRYTLSAMGLLSGVDRETALRLMLEQFGKEGAYGAVQ